MLLPFLWLVWVVQIVLAVNCRKGVSAADADAPRALSLIRLDRYRHSRLQAGYNKRGLHTDC